MRDKGDGSLSQRADGRWQASLAVTVDGIKKRRTYYGRTKAEAKAKLDAAKRERDKGEAVLRTMTLAKWLPEWLEKKRKPPRAVKPNTWNGYESKIRTYLIPLLGRHRLTALTPNQIETAYDKMRERGLSEATVRQTHMILQKALKDAMRLGLIAHSPMDRVDPPGTERNQREQWTLAQAAWALNCAGDELRWWLAIFYGMRQGEVLGLDWQFFDWERRRFSIEQTATNGYGTYARELGTPKSRASRRVLPMVGPIYARVLRKWHAEGCPTSGLLFPNAAGNLKDAARDWQEWRDFIDSCTVIPYQPLPQIALHAARNTAGSLMEAAGFPDRVVAQILGQSQVQTTHGYQNAELERIEGYLDRLTTLVDSSSDPLALGMRRIDDDTGSDSDDDTAA